MTDLGGAAVVAGDWLTRPATQAVCAMLEAAGFQALFVGGCVRNALLGAAVDDIDIATDAVPDRVMTLAAAAGFRAVPTGIGHGTVTVVSRGIAHQVTTFRRDIATDGRHAVVAFGGTLAEDAARRDFTMNALYADARGRVIDPLDGLPDVLARRVRFVGDPAARIAEDHLRILRFFRFLAWYGTEGPDADGLAACAEFAASVQDLSRERVLAELRKLLAAPDPSASVASMAQAGVLWRVLPGADPRALPVLVHLEQGLVPDWRCRLAALGGADPAATLPLSRADAARLAILRAESGATTPASALAYHHGAPVARDILLLRGALTGMPLPTDWPALVACGAAAVFPLAAADLMPALSGPALGHWLTAARARWVASDFTLTRDDLLP